MLGEIQEASVVAFHYQCLPPWLDLGQALEIIRGCQGLNVVGCDLVEVSPPYDPSGEWARKPGSVGSC